MDAPAERRKYAQAPIPDLVPEPLDDHGAVGRDDPRGRLLFAEKLQQV